MCLLVQVYGMGCAVRVFGMGCAVWGVRRGLSPPPGHRRLQPRTESSPLAFTYHFWSRRADAERQMRSTAIWISFHLRGLKMFSHNCCGHGLRKHCPAPALGCWKVEVSQISRLSPTLWNAWAASGGNKPHWKSLRTPLVGGCCCPIAAGWWLWCSTFKAAGQTHRWGQQVPNYCWDTWEKGWGPAPGERQPRGTEVTNRPWK